MGAVVDAAGSIFGGEAQSDMYEAQARIARENAKTLEQNARWTMAAGEGEVAKQGLKNRQVQGSIKARQAAGGVDVNSGSAAQVQQSARVLGQFDAMQIQSNAARAAYGYKVKAKESIDQAKLLDQAADNAVTAGYIGAASSLIDGAGKVATGGAGGSALLSF